MNDNIITIDFRPRDIFDHQVRCNLDDFNELDMPELAEKIIRSRFSYFGNKSKYVSRATIVDELSNNGFEIDEDYTREDLETIIGEY